MLNPAIIQKHQGARLPHWKAENARYFVTFRLVESAPSKMKRKIEDKTKDIFTFAKQMKRSLSSDELDELEELHFRRLDLLRWDHGARHLADQRIAKLLSDALNYFDSQRYQLLAWTIMPNHVHVVFRTFPGWNPTEILHSWKSFTATAANKLLNRTGPFWQQESYDHLIRNEDDLKRCIEYTWNNPDIAGLKEWPWRWKRPLIFATT